VDDEEISDLERRTPQWGRGGLGSLVALGVGASAASSAWNYLNGNGHESSRDSSEEQSEAWNECVPYPRPTAESWPPMQPSPGWAPPVAQPQPQPQGSPAADEAGTQYSNGGGWVPAVASVGVAPQPTEQADPESKKKPPAPEAQPLPSPDANPAPALAPSPNASPVPAVAPDVLSAPPSAVQPNGNGGQRQEPYAAGKVLTVTTTTDVVMCRKFPDTLSAETIPLTVFPRAQQVNVNCWTTASMSGPEGKVQNDAIWLRTAQGCYINEMNVQDTTDFQAKLAFCVSPPHWVATTVDKGAQQLCYQCPSLKCPNQSLGKGELVDVQCIVDGEDARGNK
jgi:hypothetical protein